MKAFKERSGAAMAALRFEVLNIAKAQYPTPGVAGMSRKVTILKMSDVTGCTQSDCNKALIAAEWEPIRALELMISDSVYEAEQERQLRLKKDHEDAYLREIEVDVSCLALACDMELSENNVKFIAGIIKLARSA